MVLCSETPNGYPVKKVDSFDNEGERRGTGLDGRDGLELSKYVFEAANSCSEIYLIERGKMCWSGTIIKDHMENELGDILDEIAAIVLNYRKGYGEVVEFRVRDTPYRIRVKLIFEIQ